MRLASRAIAATTITRNGRTSGGSARRRTASTRTTTAISEQQHGVRGRGDHLEPVEPVRPGVARRPGRDPDRDERERHPRHVGEDVAASASRARELAAMPATISTTRMTSADPDRRREAAGVSAGRRLGVGHGRRVAPSPAGWLAPERSACRRHLEPALAERARRELRPRREVEPLEEPSRCDFDRLRADPETRRRSRRSSGPRRRAGRRRARARSIARRPAPADGRR